MRKEVLWAGAIGISFGLIIAFGIWRVNSKNVYSGNVAKNTPSPTPISSSELKIGLNKPENGDVVTTDSVNVSGITKALAWLTISGEQDDYIIQSGADGVFSQDVNLIPGVNQIKITAMDSSGNQNVERVLVVYSSSFKPMTIPTPTPNGDSTESAIRQNVEQKVAQALNQPKAYLGSVTDISDSTIQIKTNDSQIKQISTANGDITVIDSSGTGSREVKISDIAIGDYIVAMGYVSSNTVLKAQRILITDTVKDSKIDSVFATVTNSDNRPIEVKNAKSDETTELATSYSTDVELFKDGKEIPTTLSKINGGDQIIYVIDNAGTTPKIRALFVVIQKPPSTPLK